MEPGAKMHMKEWLIAQIESGKYAGLCWEDEDKTMFRIPWKHAAKKDYRQTADAALFKVGFTIRHSHSCVSQLRVMVRFNFSAFSVDLDDKHILSVDLLAVIY